MRLTLLMDNNKEYYEMREAYNEELNNLKKQYMLLGVTSNVKSVTLENDTGHAIYDWVTDSCVAFSIDDSKIADTPGYNIYIKGKIEEAYLPFRCVIEGSGYIEHLILDENTLNNSILDTCFSKNTVAIIKKLNIGIFECNIDSRVEFEEALVDKYMANYLDRYGVYTLQLSPKNKYPKKYDVAKEYLVKSDTIFSTGWPLWNSMMGYMTDFIEVSLIISPITKDVIKNTINKKIIKIMHVYMHNDKSITINYLEDDVKESLLLKGEDAHILWELIMNDVDTHLNDISTFKIVRI